MLQLVALRDGQADIVFGITRDGVPHIPHQLDSLRQAEFAEFFVDNFIHDFKITL